MNQYKSHLIFLHEKKLKFVAGKMLHSSHVGLFQWLWNATLFVLENLLCTKHTDSIKAHLMQIVTTDQRPRSPLYDSNMVIMFYRLQVNASSPNWKLAYHGHFFPHFFDTLSSPGTWMQHLMLCFLTPSYETLIYRTLLHPWVHSPKSSNLLQCSESVSSSWPMALGWNVTAATLCSLRCCRSLLNPGSVIGPTRLNDLRPRGAGLLLLVTVVGDRVADLLILTDMDDHAGSGRSGSVEFILLS